MSIAVTTIGALESSVVVVVVVVDALVDIEPGEGDPGIVELLLVRDAVGDVVVVVDVMMSTLDIIVPTAGVDAEGLTDGIVVGTVITVSGAGVTESDAGVTVIIDLVVVDVVDGDGVVAAGVVMPGVTGILVDVTVGQFIATHSHVRGTPAQFKQFVSLAS